MKYSKEYAESILAEKTTQKYTHTELVKMSTKHC